MVIFMQEVQRKNEQENSDNSYYEKITIFSDFFALLMKIDKRVNPDYYKSNNKTND